MQLIQRNSGQNFSCKGIDREGRTENDHRKTMDMRLNTKIDRPIGIDGQELEDVDEFTYFVSKVTKESGASEVIKSRPQKATSAFLSLNQVWTSASSA